MLEEYWSRERKMVQNLLQKLVYGKLHIYGLSVIFVRFTNVTRSILHKPNNQYPKLPELISFENIISLVKKLHKQNC